MSTEVASAYVSIGARIAGLEAGLMGASRKLDAYAARSDRTAARASAAMAGIGRAAKLGGLAVGAGIGYAVKVAADFEAQMSNLKAVTQASASDMGKLRTQAMAMGAATIYSSREVAAAQVELGKAGMSTQQILGGGLKASLSLAAAGGLQLADAAKISANSMNNFGLSAKAARSIADQLATAANTTTGDVADFGQALENVGGVARTASISFKNTNAALMAMAKGGTIGAEAGTNLRSMLTNIATPTSKASAMMQRLGIDFYDGAGRFKDMATVSAMLRQSLGRLTPEMRQQAAATIAGSYGQKALLALYAAGPQRLKLYQDQLSRTGTAARVAATMQDNLKGKFEQLTGVIETGAIKLGTALVPALTTAAVGLTGFLDDLTGSGGFQDFASDLGSVATQGFSLLGSAATTAMGPVSALLGVVESVASTPLGPMFAGSAVGIFAGVKAVEALTGAMAILNTVTKASPWAIALTGAAALMGAIVGLNAALGSGASAQSQMAGQAAATARAHRDAAAAAADQKAAEDALRGANLDVKETALNLRDAQIAQRQAMAEAGPAAQRTAAQQAAVERANIAAARAGLAHADAVRRQGVAEGDLTVKSGKRTAAIRADIEQMKSQARNSRAAADEAARAARIYGGSGDTLANLSNAKRKAADDEAALGRALSQAPVRYAAAATAARANASAIQGRDATSQKARAGLLAEARNLDRAAAAARLAAGGMSSAGGAAGSAGGKMSAAAAQAQALASGINAIPNSKTISVSVRVARTETIQRQLGGSLAGDQSGLKPGAKAWGGQVGGEPGRDRNLAWLSRGEWVLPEHAANMLGGRKAMEAALAGRVPGYATGKKGQASAEGKMRARLAKLNALLGGNLSKDDRQKYSSERDDLRRKIRDAKYARIVTRPGDTFALGSARRDVGMARAEASAPIADDLKALNTENAANTKRVAQITGILKRNSRFLTKQEKAQLESEKASLLRDNQQNKDKRAGLLQSRDEDAAKKVADAAAALRSQLDARVAEASLTLDKGDDLAALQAQQADAQRRLGEARAAGDSQGVVDAIADLTNASNGIKAWLEDQARAQMEAKDAQIALAKLTSGSEDDRAALQAAKDDAERRLAEARAAGDNGAIIDMVNRILGLQDSIDGLTQATKENTQKFGGSSVFEQRGQRYLSMPSSDRLVGMEVGI